uniref:hypothetical protein n=2 Tax=Pseudomonadati TaxID=3379134 RepID=UPI004049EA74
IIVFLYLLISKKIVISLLELLFLIPLFIVMLLSVFYSSSAIRSLSYLVWFVACYLLYFNVIKNLIGNVDYSYILRVIRDLGRFQIVACLLLQFLGVDRPALLFYEPSYMILALLPYIYFSLIQFKYNVGFYNRIDLFLIMLLIFITMSANLLLAIILVIVVGYLRLSLKSILYLVLLSFFSYYLSYWYYQNNTDLLAFTFRNLHESPNFINTVLERTGNRWPRMMIGLDAIYDYFPNGVGLGTFSEFSINYNVDKDYAVGLPWNEPRGFPASNVFVELLAEGGVFVLTFFLLFICLLMFMPVKKSVPSVFVSHWRKMIFIFLLLLLFESSLLRPYFWAYLGILSSFLTLSNKNVSRDY